MSSKEVKTRDGVVAGFKKIAHTANKPIKEHSKSVNSIFWIITIILVIGLIAISQYYSEAIPDYLTLAVTIGIIIVFLISFYFTNQGKQFYSFVRSALREATKVHWPTRNEVLQTSLIVIGITIVVGFFFFIFDSVITLAINFITTWKF